MTTLYRAVVLVSDREAWTGRWRRSLPRAEADARSASRSLGPGCDVAVEERTEDGGGARKLRSTDD